LKKGLPLIQDGFLQASDCRNGAVLQIPAQLSCRGLLDSGFWFWLSITFTDLADCVRPDA